MMAEHAPESRYWDKYFIFGRSFQQTVVTSFFLTQGVIFVITLFYSVLNSSFCPKSMNNSSLFHYFQFQPNLFMRICFFDWSMNSTAVKGQRCSLFFTSRRSLMGGIDHRIGSLSVCITEKASKWSFLETVRCCLPLEMINGECWTD